VKNVLASNGDLSIVQSAKCLDGAPGTGASCGSQAGVWNYAQHFTYNAAGAVTAMQLGNGRWESTAFNSRLEPTQIALGRDIICVPKNHCLRSCTYAILYRESNVVLSSLTVNARAQPMHSFFESTSFWMKIAVFTKVRDKRG